MKLLFTIICAAFVLASCSNVPAQQGNTSADRLLDTEQGQCPYLTTDATGNTVISWVRTTTDSTSVFCYSIKNANGFSEPVVIPNSTGIYPHSENLPKIIFKPSGTIIALWGTKSSRSKNKYAGMVSYVQSFDNGKTWTAPRPLTSDTASSDQRYYDVTLLPDGEVGIMWLDNRKTVKQEGSAVYFAKTMGDSGFTGEHLIAQPSCQCCRTELYTDKSGAVHAVYRGIFRDSIRDMMHIVSHDGGNSFSKPVRISEDNWVINGCPHTGPGMAETAGALHFAWFSAAGQPGCFYTSSSDGGKKYKSRELVTHGGTHPQIASHSDDGVVIAWDEAFVTENIVRRKIGLQARDAKGTAGETMWVTADTSFAAYPVIRATGRNKVIVAFTRTISGKFFIGYREVTVR